MVTSLATPLNPRLVCSRSPSRGSCCKPAAKPTKTRIQRKASQPRTSHTPSVCHGRPVHPRRVHAPPPLLPRARGLLHGARRRPRRARHGDGAPRWVHTTWWRGGRRLCSAAGLTVGLGVQWTARFNNAAAVAGEPAATLQLCAGHRCLVLHLARAAAVPRALRRFLADARVTFVGYNVTADCRRLLRGRHRLAVAPGACRELREATGMGGASMEEMAVRLLGCPGLRKSKRVATSDWDGPRLSEEQVEYACVDAVVACRLGERLRVAGK
ncbi:hypothetical protein EJB05_40681, partial [Eragrostis curvula]